MFDVLELFPQDVHPEPNTGCWLATIGNNHHGYARIKLNGRRVGFHRVSYQLSNGPIPDGMEIDHLCRVTCCVNPDHLEAVTHDENIRRQGVAARQRPFCRGGHPNTAEFKSFRPDGSFYCRVCAQASRRAYKLRMAS